ncbi:MAG: stalk domain-containing protein [Eubacteriales bacterium]
MKKWLVAAGTIGLAAVFGALPFAAWTKRTVKPALSGREMKPRVPLRFVNGAALTVSRALIVSMSLTLAVTTCMVVNPPEARAAGQSQVVNGGAAAATGESLAELKEKLSKATNFNEMNEVFDSFKNQPRPNAEAAQESLGTMMDLYKSLRSTGDKATIIDGKGNAARWQLKGAARGDAVKWLWEAAETDAAPYCRQECLVKLYELGEKEIRRDDFPQAAASMEKFIQTYEDGGETAAPQEPSPLGLFTFTPVKYDFWGTVKKQLTQVKELAGLQERRDQYKDPSDLYALSAAIFHNEFLYYNHLWAGGRQGYNFIGNINATGSGRAPAEMTAFAREMINYNHSLPNFRQVYSDPGTPPEMKAKALYSTGLCYVGLDEWGNDALFAFTPSEVKQKIIATYQQFIKEYPSSSMADDALLALGAYTRDKAYLQKIIDEYTGGDMVERAKRLLTEMSSPYYRYTLYGDSVPYKVLSGGEATGFANVPREVAEWAGANLGQPFTGAKTSGEWSYILISAGEKPSAGYNVEITGIMDDGRGKLTVRYRVAGPRPGQMAAQVIICPHVLARIPASSAAVEFVDVEREGQPGGSNQDTSDTTGKSGNESNGSAKNPAGPIKLVVNGREIKPDVPPQLINGRTMAPVRWVAEALEADVKWDEQNNTVIITKKETVPESVASLPEAGATLYAVERDGMYEKFKLTVNNNSRNFAWKNVNNPTYSPQLLLNDINQDGKSELIAILTTATGTGVQVTEAHVINLEMLTETYIDNPLAITLKNVKMKVMADRVNIAIGDKNTFIERENIKAERASWFSDVGFGSIVLFTVENNELTARIGAQISPAGFIGEIKISYILEDKMYQAKNIDFTNSAVK